MKITTFVGRGLIASLFIISGVYSLFFNFNGFSGAIAAKNLPFPTILAIFVLSLKILAGTFLVFNYHAYLATISLIGFTALATVIYHNGFVDASQFNNMMKNFAIIGGLLLLL